MPTAIEIGNLVSGGSGNSLDGGGLVPIIPDPPHKFKVKTDNVSGGSTANNQIKLGTTSTGIYNFVVEWGDGLSDTITTYNQPETTHTYAAGAGTYEITITGVCIKWQWAAAVDKLKLIEISNWGGTNLTINNNTAFFGCTNLVVTATDSPTLSGDIQAGLFNCPSFTSGTENWDTSSVTGFSSFFAFSFNWNEDISKWDITNVTSFFQFAVSTSMSQANYDALLISWSQQAVQSNVPLGTSAKYTAGGAAEAARNVLVNTYNWTITDGGAN